MKEEFRCPETQDFEAVFKEICQGNQPAFDFLVAYLAWVHLIDDFIDQDKDKTTPETTVEICLTAAEAFAWNPFFNQFKTSLWPFIVTGASAYLDSLKWEKGGELERNSSVVMKSSYQELFFQVAFLIGGWQHMRKMSDKFRQYHKDD